MKATQVFAEVPRRGKGGGGVVVVWMPERGVFGMVGAEGAGENVVGCLVGMGKLEAAAGRILVLGPRTE